MISVRHEGQGFELHTLLNREPVKGIPNKTRVGFWSAKQHTKQAIGTSSYNINNIVTNHDNFMLYIEYDLTLCHSDYSQTTDVAESLVSMTGLLFLTSQVGSV